MKNREITKSQIFFALIFCWIITIVFRPIGQLVEWWHFGPSQKILGLFRFLAPYSFKEMTKITKKASQSKFQNTNCFNDQNDMRDYAREGMKHN